jgi:protoporphyrinogen oxidase
MEVAGLRIGVVGAGPAGLTAARRALELGAQVTVFEQDPRYVGGISRTVEYQGYRFDIGGHRFFSKNAAIELYWQTVLGDDLLNRPRLSRIYYDGRFYDYPLKAGNAFRNMGLANTALCLSDYLKSKIHPRQPVVSFEDWVVNQFGERLYRMFFKAYTEKVWGMPCNEISADWAAQRIKGLNLGTAVLSALGLRRSGQTIKTLIDEFRYPKLGPGMLWERIADEVVGRGAKLLQGYKVGSIRWNPTGGALEVVGTAGSSGQHYILTADHVISSMPLRSLVRALDPAVPTHVRAAAEALHYRDFVTVTLIVDAEELFPDNWIYVHDPNVKVGRIQNFKNWSPYMVPDQSKTCLGLEYFCFEGDGLWTSSDEVLLSLATNELKSIGLLGAARVLGGTVVRVPKAYPVYDDHYTANVSVIRTFLEEAIPNLQSIGRNGMHKYNNQDHAMLTGILSAENVFGGEHDLWAVNSDAEYLEQTSGERLVPKPVRQAEV